MMLDFLTHSYILCFCCGIVFLISSVTSSQDSDYMDNEVRRRREWTEWFNTDIPTSGTGDDESLASIRKRGFSVCYGTTPIDSVCRKANDPSIVFKVGTTDFTEDKLVIPCTSIGIVCRNKDQGQNNSCKDYAIRFQCLTVSDQAEQVGNLGLIGIAAGLSVIVPILCVTCMHVTRMLKERHLRHQSEPDEDETSEGPCESFAGDLPPSYSAIFGSANGSTEQLLSRTTSASHFMMIVDGHNDVDEDVNTRSDSVSSSSDDRDTGSAIYSIPNSPRLTRSLSLHSTSSSAQISILDNLPHSCRQTRIPGMHLSIFDLMFAHEDSSSSNPDPGDLENYIQTPPPSYSEAIVILGGVPYKHTGKPSTSKSDEASK